MTRIMGQMAPPAGLQMIQNWKKQVVDPLCALPFRGTSTGWRNGAMGTSQNSTKGNAKFCIWKGITPGSRQSGVQAAGEQFVVVLGAKLTKSQQHALAVKASSTLDCIEGSIGKGSGTSSTPHWGRGIWMLCPGLDSPVWDMDILEQGATKTLKDWNISLTRRDWESLEERRPREILSRCINTSWG